MASSQLTPAIVLRNRPFGESDNIVTFLTRDLGKLTGIAKGAKRSRKRFANSLEPFSLINLNIREYPQRSLAFVVEADLTFAFKQLLSSLSRIAYASYIVEITDGLIAEREENRLVFEHLRDGLSFLEENDPSLRFLTSFEIKLLRLSGYQPCLDGCKSCGTTRHEITARWHFSCRDGGILCDPCARARTETFIIGAPALEILDRLQADQGALPPRILLPAPVISEIRSVVLQFIQFHIDREIKSAPFIDQFA